VREALPDGFALAGLERVAVVRTIDGQRVMCHTDHVPFSDAERAAAVAVCKSLHF
jgi:hypothetical protein